VSERVSVGEGGARRTGTFGFMIP